MRVSYLFRRAGSNIFLTTADADVRYEITCGHCGYPVSKEEIRCPRCKRELEFCPVCSEARHTLSPRTRSQLVRDDRVCPVCGVRRVPFGVRPLAEEAGSFCVNLYGCPAGGLLLTSREFAVLPADASICPICRNDSLQPRAVQVFLTARNACLFCSTCFSYSSPWNTTWEISNPTISRLGKGPVKDPLSPCPLCGRRDSVDTKENLVTVPRFDLPQELSLEIEQYLRMAEFGRMLILFNSDHDAFSRIYKLWTDPVPSRLASATMSVKDLMEALLAGTHNPGVRQVLQQRLETLTDALERRLGPNALDFGVSYSVGKE